MALRLRKRPQEEKHWLGIEKVRPGMMNKEGKYRRIEALQTFLYSEEIPQRSYFSICISSDCKLNPANLLQGFGVSAVFVPQLLIMHIVYFNEI